MKTCNICGTSQIEWKDKKLYDEFKKKFPNFEIYDYICQICAIENGYTR